MRRERVLQKFAGIRICRFKMILFVYKTQNATKSAHRVKLESLCCDYTKRPNKKPMYHFDSHVLFAFRKNIFTKKYSLKFKICRTLKETSLINIFSLLFKKAMCIMPCRDWMNNIPSFLAWHRPCCVTTCIYFIIYHKYTLLCKRLLWSAWPYEAPIEVY